MTELSLPVQAYLLSCDPRRQRVRDRQRTGYLVRAAALTDLHLRGRLGDRAGTVRPTGRGSTGDDVLDEFLGGVVEDKSRTWKACIRRDHRGALRIVEAALADGGVARPYQRLALGLFPLHRVEILDDAVRERLAAGVDDALRGSTPAARLDRPTAALAAMAAAVELKPLVSGRDRRTLKRRLEALDRLGGPAVPALRKVFTQLRGSRAAAASGGGSG